MGEVLRTEPRGFGFGRYRLLLEEIRLSMQYEITPVAQDIDWELEARLSGLSPTSGFLADEVVQDSARLLNLVWDNWLQDEGIYLRLLPITQARYYIFRLLSESTDNGEPINAPEDCGLIDVFEPFELMDNGDTIGYPLLALMHSLDVSQVSCIVTFLEMHCEEALIDSSRRVPWGVAYASALCGFFRPYLRARQSGSYWYPPAFPDEKRQLIIEYLSLRGSTTKKRSPSEK